MAHASSSNTGPFLEKRGDSQVPEQVTAALFPVTGLFMNSFVS